MRSVLAALFQTCYNTGMKTKPNQERLDKFLAHVGIASRRSVKLLLKLEEITVNGKRVTDAGEHIDPSIDTIIYNGKKLKKRGYVYYLLHKPKNVVSTTADEFNRRNVVSLIDTTERIYPIGRLDKDTTGLIILTNDGPITQRLTHPKFHVPKKYRLTINGTISPEQLKALREGVLLRDGITSPAEVTVTKNKQPRVILEMTIHEGRNRQIRRMCETVGLDLIDLHRFQFGDLTLAGVPEGAYRELTEQEVQLLKKAAGL